MVQIRGINPHCRLALLRLDEFVKIYACATRREAERAGTRFLLQQLFASTPVELNYDENGKPHVLGAAGGISISHSHHLLGLLHNAASEHTGLDVEQIRDKVLKIRHKFLSEKEQSFIPPQHTLMHIKAWCAKEAMYKIYAQRNVDFIAHLHIEPFTEADERLLIHCTANADKIVSVEMQLEQLEEYVISYPIKHLA